MLSHYTRNLPFLVEGDALALARANFPSMITEIGVVDTLHLDGDMSVYLIDHTFGKQLARINRTTGAVSMEQKITDLSVVFTKQLPDFVWLAKKDNNYSAIHLIDKFKNEHGNDAAYETITDFAIAAFSSRRPDFSKAPPNSQGDIYMRPYAEVNDIQMRMKSIASGYGDWSESSVLLVRELLNTAFGHPSLTEMEPKKFAEFRDMVRSHVPEAFQTINVVPAARPAAAKAPAP